eukprot:1179720-Rhodomonas_salina.1
MIKKGVKEGCGEGKEKQEGVGCVRRRELGLRGEGERREDGLSDGRGDVWYGEWGGGGRGWRGVSHVHREPTALGASEAGVRGRKEEVGRGEEERRRRG